MASTVFFNLSVSLILTVAIRIDGLAGERILSIHDKTSCGIEAGSLPL